MLFCVSVLYFYHISVLLLNNSNLNAPNLECVNPIEVGPQQCICLQECPLVLNNQLAWSSLGKTLPPTCSIPFLALVLYLKWRPPELSPININIFHSIYFILLRVLEKITLACIIYHRERWGTITTTTKIFSGWWWIYCPRKGKYDMLARWSQVDIVGSLGRAVQVSEEESDQL